jgi:hypothetical protein
LISANEWTAGRDKMDCAWLITLAYQCPSKHDRRHLDVGSLQHLVK